MRDPGSSVLSEVHLLHSANGLMQPDRSVGEAMKPYQMAAIIRDLYSAKVGAQMGAHICVVTLPPQAMPWLQREGSCSSKPGLRSSGYSKVHVFATAHAARPPGPPDKGEV